MAGVHRLVALVAGAGEQQAAGEADEQLLALRLALAAARRPVVGQRLAAVDVEILLDRSAGLVMMRFPSGTEAAAESADERDVEREGARLEIGDGTAVGVERVLGAQHFEIGGEAAAIARLDEVVGALRRRQSGAASR